MSWSLKAAAIGGITPLASMRVLSWKCFSWASIRLRPGQPGWATGG